MTDETKKRTKTNIIPEEMLQAGLHFGHRTSATHPKMKPFLFGVRNTVHIFDLEKTAEKLQEALEFIQELKQNNGTLLFVGTKIQARKILEETAKECRMPYVAERWLGGTFTNFETIKKRAEHLKDLDNKKAAGELEKYTKKERLDLEKEMKKLETKFGGIKDMQKLPEAIFVCDMKESSLAIKEAREKNIKIVAIADTNVNPSLADYPIPANDDAISSVKYILDKVKETLLD